MKREIHWAIIFLLLLAVAIRLPGLFTELWLDEHWSLGLATALSSPLEVFTKLNTENNHILYSLYLYFVGAGHNFAIYRIPSIVCGILTLILSLRIGDLNRFEARTRLVVLGVSYPLVLYSSEARGYSCMLFFALYALLAMQDYFRSPSLRVASLFWLSSILGFLAHFTFLNFYLAAGLYSLILSTPRKHWQSALGKLITIHSLPVLVFAAFSKFYFPRLEPGSGPMSDILDIAIQSLSYVLGGPETTSFSIPQTACAMGFALVVLVMIIRTIADMYQRKDPSWILYLGVIFIAPILSIVIFQPRSVLPRHFLLPILFSSILFARIVSSGLNGRLPKRVLALSAMLVFCVGNGARYLNLLTYGRGQYLEALTFAAQNTSNGKVLISGDNDFRNSMLINFYRNLIEGAPQIEYISKDVVGSEANSDPQWYLINKHEEQFVPNALIHQSGRAYSLVGTFPSAPLVGWNWFLYRQFDNGR